MLFMEKLCKVAFGGSPLVFILRYVATLGYILTLIAACGTHAHAQATTAEPPDTLSGIALVLEVRLSLTPDATGNAYVGYAEVVTPVHVWAVRYPIDMVPADLRGKSVGYVTRFFRKDGNKEIAPDDVLMFKIRDE